MFSILQSLDPQCALEALSHQHSTSRTQRKVIEHLQRSYRTVHQTHVSLLTLHNMQTILNTSQNKNPAKAIQLPFDPAPVAGAISSSPPHKITNFLVSTHQPNPFLSPSKTYLRINLSSLLASQPCNSSYLSTNFNSLRPYIEPTPQQNIHISEAAVIRLVSIDRVQTSLL